MVMFSYIIFVLFFLEFFVDIFFISDIIFWQLKTGGKIKMIEVKNLKKTYNVTGTEDVKYLKKSLLTKSS